MLAVVGPSHTWNELADLAVAIGLSAAVGLERDLRQKNAGLRTHSLVGLGAALFMLVSKFGFYDVIDPKLIVLDPSRIAAQIVTGIGFVGAGLIFVNKEKVRGLTTAASVWCTAAIGSVAGAGLLVLATAGTVGYLVVVVGLQRARELVLGQPDSRLEVSLTYETAGALQRFLDRCVESGFAVGSVSIHRDESARTALVRLSGSAGHERVHELLDEISAMQDVRDVDVVPTDGGLES